MIRFVDIRNQGTGWRFAFWDTISDSFRQFNDTFAWNNWTEFQEDYKDDGGHELQRYKNKCPDWVFDGGEDDMETFHGFPAESP